MKVIKPSITFDTAVDGKAILSKLERCARTCYQSHEKANGTPEKLIGSVIKRGHTSVLEHVQLTFYVVTDRGVSHEWVRHRIASYSQESTRYVKYGDGMEFIEPIELSPTDDGYLIWKYACANSAINYSKMIDLGYIPQVARSVLNNSLKTEMCISMNLRSLRNFLDLRCDKAAHPHIKQIAIPLLLYLKEQIPVVFDDIEYDKEFYDRYLSDNRWREYVYNKDDVVYINMNNDPKTTDVSDTSSPGFYFIGDDKVYISDIHNMKPIIPYKK